MAGLTLCDGACIDLLSNVQHCGSCGNECAPEPNSQVSCVFIDGGVCAYECDPGFVPGAQGTCVPE